MNMVLYAQCLLYLGAGISHFVMPRFFEGIVPDWLPAPRLVNIVAGVVEILFAIGLFFPATRTLSAWLVIIFLIVVFPANIKQMKQRSSQRHMPLWLAWLIRLPMQLLLIYGAFTLI